MLYTGTMTETSGVSNSGCLGAAGYVAGAFMRAMVADGGDVRCGGHALPAPTPRVVCLSRGAACVKGAERPLHQLLDPVVQMLVHCADLAL